MDRCPLAPTLEYAHAQSNSKDGNFLFKLFKLSNCNTRIFCTELIVSYKILVWNICTPLQVILDVCLGVPMYIFANKQNSPTTFYCLSPPPTPALIPENKGQLKIAKYFLTRKIKSSLLGTIIVIVLNLSDKNPSLLRKGFT